MTLGTLFALLAPPPPRRGSLLVLAGLLAVCFGVAAAGGWATALTVDGWYRDLEKPSFTPPDGVFAPVWTLLYLVMALAAWLVWRRSDRQRTRVALVMFAVQLGLNLLWPFLFFALKLPGAGLVCIALLFLAVLGTVIVFWDADRLGGALMLPYLLWVGFAAVLNAEIWILN
jgi:tryptophan-rich sensory protein